MKYFNFERYCSNEIRYFKTLFVGTKITAFLAFLVSLLYWSGLIWVIVFGIEKALWEHFLLYSIYIYIYIIYIYKDLATMINLCENLGKTKVWVSLLCQSVNQSVNLNLDWWFLANLLIQKNKYKSAFLLTLP